MSKIIYPYLPEGREIKYASEDNQFLTAAKGYAFANSLDKAMPTASVLVKDHKIIGIAANGSSYHDTHECERIKRGIPTGEGYELCEGCHPRNHSERRAVEDAQAKQNDTQNSDLYLWGHWWCCQPCWEAMILAGVKNVYVMENSDTLFNKKNPGNIVGRQFEKNISQYQK
nr:Cytidine and deoxycytidylate deaminase zinc-binding region [uncultured bacterium]